MNYTQNNKIAQVLESTLVIGVNIGSEWHYARAFDWRGVELTRKVFRFSNALDGFQSFEQWAVTWQSIAGKTQIYVGCEPAGHYWLTFGRYVKEHGMKPVLVNPYHVKQSKELDDNSPRKTDQKDSKTIAMLVKDGRYIIPYMPEGIYAKVRSAITSRDQILRELNTASVKDRTEDYRYNWDAPLFLNDPNGEDPDVQTVSLCDVHIPLRYRVGKNRTPADEQKAPLLELLARPGGHLVLGDPGIGKSSLISRYLNASGDTRSQLVYRLTDFQISGKEERPGESLLELMGITKKALEECILFLDGLDECGLTPENRAGFLNGLAEDWRTLAGKNVSWVVTCRLGYLLENALRSIQRITLLPLEPGEKGQIDAFLTKYEKAAKTDIPPEKRSVLTSPTLGKTSDTPFGIPLILYMVAASKDVTVTKDSTLVTIYDQLFPALYEHSYDSYGHRLTETLQAELHLMSRKVALWMLLHEPGRAVIPEEVYCDIGASFGGLMKEYEVHRIASYLRMAFTEGKEELCFVHRAMFEYFVGEGFVALAVPGLSPEALSGAIARYWHSYDLSSDKQDHDAIRKYVSEKLEQKRASLDFPRWEQVGLRLLEKGVVRCCGDLPDAVLGCPVCGKTLKEDRLREHTAFRSLCWLLNRVRELTG